MYEYIRQLHDLELWSSLSQVGAMTLCLVDNHRAAAATHMDTEMHHPTPSTSTGGGAAAHPLALTLRQQLNVKVMLAEALFNTKQYRRSETLYKEALQVRRCSFILVCL